MVKVICDTNIWYDIGEAEIKFNSSIPELYCTYLSLHELIHTENLKTNFPQLRNACKAVLTYSKGFILEPPIKHLFNLCNPNDLKISESNFINAIECLASINSIDEDIIIELDKYLLMKHYTLTNYFVSYINDEIHKARTEIFKNKGNRNEYKQITRKNDIVKKRLTNLKYQIVNDIKYEFPLVKDEQFKESFWDKIDFYINSRLKYFEKLRIDRKMKPQPNDAVDLLNLVYVNEDCLYWTKDTRWKNIFIESKLEKYLFDYKYIK